MPGLKTGQVPADMRCQNGQWQRENVSPEFADVDCFLNYVYEFLVASLHRL